MDTEQYKQDISNIILDCVNVFDYNLLYDELFFNEFIDFVIYIYKQFSSIDTINIKDIVLNFRDDTLYSYKTPDLFSEICDIISNLNECVLPKQRSPEWYIYRNNRLTASDLGTILGCNPYSKRKHVILKKCGHEEPFFSSLAVLHGIKFESIAINIYENRNNVTIKEYGCMPHKTIPYFGASPDGICDINSKNKKYIGRMLEIKCPKSRKITNFIPTYYELQIQGQLEVCNLHY